MNKYIIISIIVLVVAIVFFLYRKKAKGKTINIPGVGPITPAKPRKVYKKLTEEQVRQLSVRGQNTIGPFPIPIDRKVAWVNDMHDLQKESFIAVVRHFEASTRGKIYDRVKNDVFIMSQPEGAKFLKTLENLNLKFSGT